MFPLSKVQRLSDYGGTFVLSVKCQTPDCGHERTVPVLALSKFAGREARVADVVRRLRCSKCQRKHVDVMVGIPR